MLHLVVDVDVFFVFFFQAEDGIRDLTVTGVQTCALPISVLGRVGNADAEMSRHAAARSVGSQGPTGPRQECCTNGRTASRSVAVGARRGPSPSSTGGTIRTPHSGNLRNEACATG